MAEFGDVVHKLVTTGCDLSLRQIDAMLHCHTNQERAEARTVRAMATALNISKPAITRALDRLSEQGYGARKTDPLDRRSVIYTLTPKGRAFAESARGAKTKAA